jgi:hypothetical protein
MSCKCPKGWCYQQADCRHPARPKSAAKTQSQPTPQPVGDIKLQQLLASHERLIHEIADLPPAPGDGRPHHRRRALCLALHAVERAIGRTPQAVRMIAAARSDLGL